MSDPVTLQPAGVGLAGLLSVLQPRDPSASPPLDLAAIREAGWTEGFSAGHAGAAAELAPLRLHLAEAAEALHAACRIDVDGLRPLLLELVRSVAEAVLTTELRSGAAVLMPMVEAGLAAVRQGEAVTLRAHPATLAVLRPHLPDIAVAQDPELPIDGFVIDGPDFVITAGLTARLHEIMGEIL